MRFKEIRHKSLKRDDFFILRATLTTLDQKENNMGRQRLTSFNVYALAI